MTVHPALIDAARYQAVYKLLNKIEERVPELRGFCAAIAPEADGYPRAMAAVLECMAECCRERIRDHQIDYGADPFVAFHPL